jgi:hypothetical protein
MHTSSHTIRRVAAALGLAAALAALAVPAALAGSHARTLGDGRSPDTRDAALQAQTPTAEYIPFVTDFPRAGAATSQSIPRVGNGVFGPAVPSPSGSVTIGPKADGRSPDTRDAATSQSIPRVGNGVFGPAVPTPSGPVTIGPSPDTADAALLAHSPVVTLTKPSTFAWREFGIGAAAAAGAILLLLGVRAGLLAGRGRGKVAHPTVSA